MGVEFDTIMLNEFLKSDSATKMMFAWVMAVHYNLPSVSEEKAIKQFYKYFNLSEEEFMKQQSALRTLQRMKTQFIELSKSGKL